MAYTCEECHVAQLPRTPMIKVPVSVTMTEHVQRDGNLLRVVGHGVQIIREKRLCPSCAGVPYQQPKEMDMKPWLLLAHGYFFHLGVGKPERDKCKGFKVRDGETILCSSCETIKEGWAKFPLQALAIALQDKKAR